MCSSAVLFFQFDHVVSAAFSESKRPSASKDAESEQDLDDFTVLKSLADGQKSKETTEVPLKKEDQYVPDESDSTKSRRLAEDYDSTKNGMDYGKYQGTHACHHASCPYRPLFGSDSFCFCDLCPPSPRAGHMQDASDCRWQATRQTF